MSENPHIKLFSSVMLCLSFFEELPGTLRGKVSELEKEMPLTQCDFLLKKYQLRELLKCVHHTPEEKQR